MYHFHRPEEKKLSVTADKARSSHFPDNRSSLWLLLLFHHWLPSWCTDLSFGVLSTLGKCLLEDSLSISFYVAFCNSLPRYVNSHLEQLILKNSPIAISWYFSGKEVLFSVRKQAVFRMNSVTLKWLVNILWKSGWYFMTVPQHKVYYSTRLHFKNSVYVYKKPISSQTLKPTFTVQWG